MTSEEISKAQQVVCPICSAAKGGKCLTKIRDGRKYREVPHNERFDLAGISIDLNERGSNAK